MKKQLFSLLGAGALLLGLTTGCSSESIEPAAGDDGTVSFTLTLPSGISSRAYSDGLTATKLTYAVYDDAATDIKPIINETVEPFNSGLTGTVSFKLVTGKTYDILFWADSYGGTNSPYTFDADAQTITVDYTDAESCDENRDAFFAARTGLKVTGPVSETITLTRPFAQINFGSDDLEEPTVKDMTSLKAKVTTKAYTTLNLKDGSVTGDPVDVTFSAAEFPTAESFPYEPATYGYVSMNYLLVKDTKETLDQLVLTIENDGAEVNTVKVPNAPVQRNYRTNIYGSLLTSTALFNIIIEPNFNTPDYTVIAGNNPQDAKDALETSDGPVMLSSDVDLTGMGYVDLPAEQTIDLNGKTLTADGIYARYVGAEITISNGTLDLTNSSILMLKEANVTLDKVTVKSTGDAIVCGMQGSGKEDYNANKITITNSTIDAGSVGVLIQNKDNVVTIEGTTINHKWFGITQNGTIPGSTVNLKSVTIIGPYSGIYLSNYADGQKNTLTVEGCTITSEQESAIEVKKTDITVTGSTLASKATSQSYSVNGGGSNGIGYGIVLAGYVVGTAYEGETTFSDNTFTLAAGESAIKIAKYNGTDVEEANK